MVHMTSSRRSREVETEDGRIDVMDYMDLLTQLYRFHCIRFKGYFSLLTKPINRTLRVGFFITSLIFICIF
jgi:hypothetical protein